MTGTEHLKQEAPDISPHSCGRLDIKQDWQLFSPASVERSAHDSIHPSSSVSIKSWIRAAHVSPNCSRYGDELQGWNMHLRPSKTHRPWQYGRWLLHPTTILFSGADCRDTWSLFRGNFYYQMYGGFLVSNVSYNENHKKIRLCLGGTSDA